MKLDWKQIVVGILIGVLIGMGCSMWCLHRRGPRYWNSPDHYKHMLSRLNSKLSLTPDQSSQIGTILETNRKKIEGLHNEVKPKFMEIRNATNDEIHKLLNTDQQQKFDVMRQKWEARWKK